MCRTANISGCDDFASERESRPDEIFGKDNIDTVGRYYRLATHPVLSENSIRHWICLLR